MEDKRFWTEYKQTLLDFNPFLSSSCYTFNPLGPLQNIWNFPPFQGFIGYFKAVILSCIMTPERRRILRFIICLYTAHAGSD